MVSLSNEKNLFDVYSGYFNCSIYKVGNSARISKEHKMKDTCGICKTPCGNDWCVTNTREYDNIIDINEVLKERQRQNKWWKEALERLRKIHEPRE